MDTVAVHNVHLSSEDCLIFDPHVDCDEMSRRHNCEVVLTRHGLGWRPARGLPPLPMLSIPYFSAGDYQAIACKAITKAVVAEAPNGWDLNAIRLECDRRLCPFASMELRVDYRMFSAWLSGLQQAKIPLQCPPECDPRTVYGWLRLGCKVLLPFVWPIPILALGAMVAAALGYSIAQFQGAFAVALVLMVGIGLPFFLASNAWRSSFRAPSEKSACTKVDESRPGTATRNRD